MFSWLKKEEDALIDDVETLITKLVEVRDKLKNYAENKITEAEDYAAQAAVSRAKAARATLVADKLTGI